ncbi:polysaccharide deacetylase family protein [Roseibacterium sp. SDUM158017]|uniref:polysaccharide deacetylase family protein n=1 Tax=Roseicyclus salinarum TaxID=3036773 RepID=UPI002414F08A|nr:polysaccharide deacetylase family protein [Roseibacterium sp. SDUM158017]MDG4650175.1 polysaccharide deacetylase family protein [Roseibacterium sp. SDUM158017]
MRWPNGAGLAVSVVVNVEEGAELTLTAGDERNEHIYEAVERVDGAPDPCMESHFEYGPRAGWPRIRAALRDRGVPATLNACGRALEATPWIATEAVGDGHEVAAHGWRWERHAGMDAATERAAIARTVAAIDRIAGAPPLGWHTRSATSPNTRALLVEQGGFLYDSNAYNDDIPYTVDTAQGPHVVLPYAFDTNDMRFYNGGGFVFAEDFARYCIAAFDRLLAESERAPRLLSIGLHTRIIGRPARIGGLEMFLDHALRANGAWFASRADIARAWRGAIGLPEWTRRPCPADFASGSPA